MKLIPLFEKKSPAELKKELISKYTTDEAIGVKIEGGGDDEQAVIPGYGPAFICTNYAHFIQDKEKAIIVGFHAEDNPDSEISDIADGHDFAIVGGRFIVDPWIVNTENLSKKAVFDLEDPKDKADIKRFYGDRTKWKLINGKFVENNKAAIDKYGIE